MRAEGCYGGSWNESWRGHEPQQREHRVHIDKLWDEFTTFAEGRGGARYSELLQGVPNPFGAWDVDQRYYHESFFTRHKVEEHKNAAKEMMLMMQKAQADGVVPWKE